MNIADIEDLDGVIVIRIYGSLSVKVINEFDSICEDQIIKKPQIIALDCSNLDFIDSIAINHLFRFSHNAKSKDIKLVFYDINPTIKEIFKITNLDKLLTVVSKDQFEAEYIEK